MYSIALSYESNINFPNYNSSRCNTLIKGILEANLNEKLLYVREKYPNDDIVVYESAKIDGTVNQVFFHLKVLKQVNRLNLLVKM
jgi:hypothetical protein